jgi:hypothetical protein
VPVAFGVPAANKDGASFRTRCVLTMLGPMRLDLLDILFVQARKFASRFAMRAQQLIDLGMYGLGVPMLGSGDEQRHHPRCQGGNCSPSECLGREGKPCDRVEHYNRKGDRMGRELSNAR